ncbi:MAG: GNAT family N-acetyltransferase [Fusobacteriaceae bacterium]
MKVRYAYDNKIDKDLAISLWSNCFNDSKKYMEFFFSTHYKYSNFLLYENFGGLHLTPYNHSFFNSINISWYIQGVGVFEKYRRKGIMKTLIIKTLENAKEEGLREVFLIPVNPAVYTPFNFEFSHILEKYYTSKDELRNFMKNKEYSIVQVSLNILDSVYQDILDFYHDNMKKFDSFVVKNFDNLKFFLEELELEKSSFFYVKKNSHIVGLFSLVSHEKILEIRDLFFNNKEILSNIFYFIYNSFHCEQDILITAPQNSQIETYFSNRLQIRKTISPFIMMRIIDVKRVLFESILKNKTISSSSITIYVEDNLIPSNQGYYTIDLLNKTVEYKKKSFNCDLEINISTLVELIYGTTSPSILLKQNKLKIKNVKNLKKIEKFFTLKTNYILEYI